MGLESCRLDDAYMNLFESGPRTPSNKSESSTTVAYGTNPLPICRVGAVCFVVMRNVEGAWYH